MRKRIILTGLAATAMLLSATAAGAQNRAADQPQSEPQTEAQTSDAVTLTAETQTKKWTLQECIDYAIENNISLRQSRNTQLSGLEDTYQAKAAMFHSLSASASEGFTNRPFTESGSNTVIGSDVYSTSKNSSLSGNYNLSAQMTLFSGGSLRTALKQSRLQNSVDSLSVLESTNDIVISIIKAYMQ